MTKIIIDSAAAGGKAEGWNTTQDKIEELKLTIDFNHWDGNHNSFSEILEDEEELDEDEVLDILDEKLDCDGQVFGVGGAFVFIEDGVSLMMGGDIRKIQNGIEDVDDLIEYAKNTLTEFGNKNLEEDTEIDLLDFFDSKNNDDYLIKDDSGEYYILVGNMPYTAYKADDIEENRKQVIET